MGAKWGQVFLHDQNIIHKLVSLVDPTIQVVEIGCGEGCLTQPISQITTVHSFEIDTACVDATCRQLPLLSRVHFWVGDVMALSQHWPSLGRFQVVANIPYYISAPILKLLVQYHDFLHSAVIMVQTEFAYKLIQGANQPFYSSLGVYIRSYFDVSLLFHVSPNSFSPVPKVGSSVIRLTPHQRPLPIAPEAFFAMVRSGFWGRRKPLSSALIKSPYLIRGVGFKSALINHPYAFRRGEMLTDEEWRELHNVLHPHMTSQLPPSTMGS